MQSVKAIGMRLTTLPITAYSIALYSTFDDGFYSTHVLNSPSMLTSPPTLLKQSGAYCIEHSEEM